MEFRDKQGEEKLPISLKGLYFIGGLFSSCLLFLFIIIFGLKNNDAIGIIILGICAIGIAICSTRIVETQKRLYAFIFPLFITGYGLVACWFAWSYDASSFTIFGVLLITSVISWIFCRNHVLRQCIMLTILWLIPHLFFKIKFSNNPYFIYYAIILMGIYMLTIIHDADHIKNPNVASEIYVQYIPTIRFCTAAMAIYFVLAGKDQLGQSILCAILSAITISIFFIKKCYGKERLIGFALALVVFAASIVTPNIALAILGLLLTFTVLDYAGMAMFGIFLLYSIGNFYYDLDTALIHKSYVLMGSGALFLSLFFVYKKITK